MTSSLVTRDTQLQQRAMADFVAVYERPPLIYPRAECMRLCNSEAGVEIWRWCAGPKRVARARARSHFSRN